MKAAGVTLLPVEQNVEWALNLAALGPTATRRSRCLRRSTAALSSSSNVKSGEAVGHSRSPLASLPILTYLKTELSPESRQRSEVKFVEIGMKAVPMARAMLPM
jgi:hypothetical protein